ncbi:13761_t:CDS:2, partial [Acaulospora morrowiae]
TRPRNTSTLDVVIIDSDTDDNGTYTLNMNSNLQYGSQGYFGSNVTILSTNTQSSPSSISLNSRSRTDSDRNGGGPIRSSSNRASRSSSRRSTSNRTSPGRSTRSQNSSERYSAILNINSHHLHSGNSSVRQHSSAFLPYNFSVTYTAEGMTRHDSHESQFPLRNSSATTNLNSNDVQILSTPPPVP